MPPTHSVEATQAVSIVTVANAFKLDKTSLEHIEGLIEAWIVKKTTCIHRI